MIKIGLSLIDIWGRTVERTGMHNNEYKEKVELNFRCQDKSHNPTPTPKLIISRGKNKKISEVLEGKVLGLELEISSSDEIS